jgi:hypothetical protein
VSYKSAILLALVLLTAVSILFAPRLSAAEGESHFAYLPLIFNNYPPPPPQRFFDDFSDPTNNWFVGDNAAIGVGHVDGEYHMQVKDDRTLVAVVSPAEFGVIDYTLAVDVRQIGGG